MTLVPRDLQNRSDSCTAIAEEACLDVSAFEPHRAYRLLVAGEQVDSLVAPSNSVTLDVEDNALYWLLA